METEAKFVVPSEATFARLRSAERFGPYEKQGETTKSYHDRYVDTPDRRFYNLQLYVRLREEKDGGTLLTVKRLGAAPQGAIHARDEYQVKVPGADRKEWPESDVRSMVDEVAADEPLVDIVSVDQTRTISNLIQDGRTVAELSLDEVTVQTPHGPVTAYELEAELKDKGLDADLSTLAGIFAGEYGLEAQPLTKFERAMRLSTEDSSKKGGTGTKARKANDSKLSGMTTSGGSTKSSFNEPLLESGLTEPNTLIVGIGDAGQATTSLKLPASESKARGAKKKQKKVAPANADEVGLKETDSIDTAGRKIVRSYFETMLANEKGTIEGKDPEALHDMRVATRRMRSALRVLGPYLQASDPTRVRRGLRAVASALGDVRDMDVLISNAEEFRDKLPEEQRPGLDGLLKSWKSDRDKSRKRLVRLLGSSNYSRLKRSVKSFIKEQKKAPTPDPADITDLQQPFQVRHIAPTAILTRYEAVRAFEAITDSTRKDASKGHDIPPEASARIDTSKYAFPPTIEQLHALRISGKYLRYTMECFRETLPGDATGIIRDVTKMQDQLGDLHDADVAIGLINEYIDRQKARHKKADPRYSVPVGLNAYLEEREAAIRHLHADFFSTWTRMQSQEWKARLAAVIMA